METGTFLGVKSDFTPRKPPLYSEETSTLNRPFQNVYLSIDLQINRLFRLNIIVKARSLQQDLSRN